METVGNGRFRRFRRLRGGSGPGKTAFPRAGCFYCAGCLEGGGTPTAKAPKSAGQKTGPAVDDDEVEVVGDVGGRWRWALAVGSGGGRWHWAVAMGDGGVGDGGSMQQQQQHTSSMQHAGAGNMQQQVACGSSSCM